MEPLAAIAPTSSATASQRQGLLVQDNAATDQAIRSESIYFRVAAPALTTPEALLADPRAASFVATALGLGADPDQAGTLRQLTTAGPTAASSIVQKLGSTEAASFASTIVVWAPPPFSSQATIDAAIAGFRKHYAESLRPDPVAPAPAPPATQAAAPDGRAVDLFA